MMTEQATHLPAAPQATMQDQTLARWNWGAFTFTWVWAFGMRLWMWAIPLWLINVACYYLIALSFHGGAALQSLPLKGEGGPPAPVALTSSIGQIVWLDVIVNLAAAIALGWMGNRLAWKSRNWNGLLHFRVTQIAWEKYGRPIGIAVLTIVPMYFILSKFAS